MIFSLAWVGLGMRVVVVVMLVAFGGILFGLVLFCPVHLGSAHHHPFLPTCFSCLIFLFVSVLSANEVALCSWCISHRLSLLPPHSHLKWATAGALRGGAVVVVVGGGHLMTPFFFRHKLATHTHDDLAMVMIVGREVFFYFPVLFSSFSCFCFFFLRCHV